MTTRRLATLDGLRGLAILLVVWFHVWQITWLRAPDALEFIPETGFAGVDLFFFISGFVISYPFIRAQIAGLPLPAWSHFAYRRFIKIVPSYVLSIVACIAIGYAHFSSLQEAAVQLLTHLAFVHTWFGDAFGGINGVLWSLAVEVQFYVIFPIVWWCFRRSAVWTGGVLFAAALAYRVVAAACCLHTTAPRLIDNLPGFLDLFAMGMLAAWVFVRFGDRHRSPRTTALATLLAFAGVALFVILLMDLYAFRRADMWDTNWQIVKRSGWAIAFFCIATGTLFGAAWWRAVVGNRLLLACGAISYNWYLFHQVIARELLAARIPPYATAHPFDDPVWQHGFTVVAFGVTAAVAAAVTYGFERPLMRLRIRSSAPSANGGAERAVSRPAPSRTEAT
jgi:peptidoglycan/LPS O-acetylase OafA/YrhL